MSNTVTVADYILRGLNPEQQLAVTTTDGPVLIIAGAGSGKTRTLVHRIAYLMAVKHVPAGNILAVTFTNKAGQNMRERMADLLGDNPQAPLMGTFHSISSRVLRQYGDRIDIAKNFVIYDSNDQLSLVKKIMKELGYDTKHVAPSAIHYKISAAKNQLITPDQFEREVSDAFDEVAAKVYPRYQVELRRLNAVDFDDLLMETVHLWQQHPDVLEHFRQLWKYVLVDEYQDTNRTQYQWIRLLTDEHRNLCVVGDDAQSIYSWRMADMTNILNFEKDYANATVILLEQNYRSTQLILEAANKIISKNKNQKPKKLWTENPTGVPIVVAEVADEEAEGRFIVQTIIKWDDGNKVVPPSTEITYDDSEADVDWEATTIQPGESILSRIMHQRRMDASHGEHALRSAVASRKRDTDFNKNVVLYRTNAQSRAIEEAFIQYGVPYTIIGGLRFYERREIRDCIAYLRAVVNPSDWVALERVVNLPPRGIGARTWFKIEQFAMERQWSIIEASKQAIPGITEARLSAFFQLANVIETIHNKLPELSPTEAFDFLLKHTGYEEYVYQYSETKDQAEGRLENIQELKNVLKKHDHLRADEGLQKILEELALVSDQDSVDETNNTVKLMTIHAAKGLEFPTVFVVGMEEGLFPHSRTQTSPHELEEERRLCYVALTRAEEHLYLLHASQRLRFGNLQVNAPSRFLKDLPDNTVERRVIN